MLLASPDPVQLGRRSDNQAIARDGRRRHAHFVERILAQQFVPVTAALP
jgi:hypothetical protein